MDDAARLGVLYPATAEAARRAGASAIGLVALDRPTSDEPVSLTTLSITTVGPRAVPTRALPEVVFRETVDPGSLESLPDVLARVPAGALPVVTTAWVLSGVTLEARLRYLQRLDAAATTRPVAWVSVEGVGVAPAVPTLGDRPASGHSIVGVVVLEHRTLHAEAVGRCWSRGRYLSWLAD